MKNIEKEFNGILFIIRGLSGSGKTTLAQSITDYVAEADDYFYEENEQGETVYNWDGSKLPQAHQWCYDKVERWMKETQDKIAVSNTNTRYKEFKEYIELAEKYDYRYHVMTVENYHGGENTHGVPESTLDSHEARYELKLRNEITKVNQ